MKTTIKKQPQMTLQEFADLHGLTLSVKELKSNDPDFLADFDQDITSARHQLITGSGETPFAAIKDLCLELSFQRVRLFSASQQDDIIVEVPRITWDGNLEGETPLEA